jgi:TRAP-type uncharacterized transport system fused permease subunit
MFVFNAELVLVGVHSFGHALLIFVMAVFGAFAFSNAVQGWFITRNKWFEFPLFFMAAIIFFFPGIVTRICNIDPGLRYYMYALGFILYGIAYMTQRVRLGKSEVQI